MKKQSWEEHQRDWQIGLLVNLEIYRIESRSYIFLSFLASFILFIMNGRFLKRKDFIMKESFKLLLEKGLFMICKPSLVLFGMKNHGSFDEQIDGWTKTNMGQFYLRNLGKIGKI